MAAEGGSYALLRTGKSIKKGGAVHRELLPVHRTGSYSRSVLLERVNLFRLPRLTRLLRGWSPRATPGATYRELLPISIAIASDFNESHDFATLLVFFLSVTEAKVQRSLSFHTMLSRIGCITMQHAQAVQHCLTNLSCRSFAPSAPVHTVTVQGHAVKFLVAQVHHDIVARLPLEIQRAGPSAQTTKTF